MEAATLGARGRPSEQLKRETSEGKVWTIVSKLLEYGDFGNTIRDIVRLSRCSIGAVARTMAWRGYLRVKKAYPGRRHIVAAAETRRRREEESVEGRVIQIVMEASARNDFSLSVRKIADKIGCSSAAVGKTRAWKGYVQAREEEKEAARSRRKGQRIK